MANAVRICDLHIIQKAAGELLKVALINTPFVLLKRTVKLLQKITSTLTESFILYNCCRVRDTVGKFVSSSYLITYIYLNCTCLWCICNSSTYGYIVTALGCFTYILHRAINRRQYSSAFKRGGYIKQSL